METVTRWCGLAWGLAFVLGGCTSGPTTGQASDPRAYSFVETVRTTVGSTVRVSMREGIYDPVVDAYHIVPSGVEGGPLEIVITPHEALIRMEPGSPALAPGRSWFSAPMLSGREPWVGHPSPFDVEQLRSLASEVEERGPREIRGVATERYRLTMTDEQVARSTRAGVPTPSSIAVVLSPRQRVDVWVDQRGRIVRFAYEAMQGSLPIEVTVDFTFDIEATVEIPSRADVMTPADQIRSSG